MSRRIRELDGLRAGAVLAVIGCHWMPGYFPGGFVGVDLFFVISGYVISSALFAELSEGGISYGHFYARRFFRIVPPLVAMVAVVVIFTRDFVDAAAALLSVMNWRRAFFGVQGSLFAHAWSLSIEEQFYLLWPLAAALLWKHGTRPLVIAIVAVMLYRVALVGFVSPMRIHNGLDTHCDGLLLGCLLARSSKMRIGKAWPAAALGLVLVSILGDVNSPWMLALGFPFVNACSAVLVVAALNPSPLFSRLTTIAPVQWCGLRSYAIYLWHFPIGVLLGERLHGPVLIGSALALTFVMAELSYLVVERPAREFGKGFGQSHVMRPRLL